MLFLKTSLFVYGPGYIYFDENKSLNHIINTYGPFDVILIVMHGFMI